MDSETASVLKQTRFSEQAVERYGHKLAYLKSAVRVSIAGEDRLTPGLCIKVEYDSPLWVPAVSRGFATERKHNQFIRTLTAETWVPLTADCLERRGIGIPYLPSNAESW